MGNRKLLPIFWIGHKRVKKTGKDSAPADQKLNPLLGATQIKLAKLFSLESSNFSLVWRRMGNHSASEITPNTPCEPGNWPGYFTVRKD
jgi:hypothetical protein